MQILTFSHIYNGRSGGSIYVYAYNTEYTIGCSALLFCVRSDRFFAYEIIIILPGVAPLPFAFVCLHLNLISGCREAVG